MLTRPDISELSQSAMSRRTVYLVSLTVWAVASVATLVFWNHLTERNRIQSLRIVETSAEQAALRLEDFVRSRQFVLESIADSYENGRVLDEADFRSTAQVVHHRLDGLLAVNWISRDSRIQWAVPLAPNRAAVGKKVEEHPFASDYYRSARQSGQSRATEPMELFQGGKGIATYFPVYRDGTYLGTVNGVFRTTTLVETALSGGMLDDYAVRIQDGDEVFFDHPSFEEASRERITVSRELSAFDRTWRISLTPKDLLWDSFDRQELPTLFIGLVCSLLLGLLVFFILALQRARFEKLREVQVAQKRLHEAQRFEALGRFARGITHDFNNLLTGIRTGAQLLELDGGLTPHSAENLESILLSADRAAVLTRQLMTFGRARSAVVSPGENTNLRLFASAWQRFVSNLVPERVELVYETPPPLSAAIDDSSLARILTNLVINGVDAMPQGGELGVTWTGDEETVSLRVSDTGTGMSEAVRARIFEPYFTTKVDDEGTGLGLPTVKQLVDSAGGTISVESSPGVGTTFIVSLPRVF